MQTCHRYLLHARCIIPLAQTQILLLPRWVPDRVARQSVPKNTLTIPVDVWGKCNAANLQPSRNLSSTQFHANKLYTEVARPRTIHWQDWQTVWGLVGEGPQLIMTCRLLRKKTTQTDQGRCRRFKKSWAKVTTKLSRDKRYCNVVPVCSQIRFTRGQAALMNRIKKIVLV